MSGSEAPNVLLVVFDSVRAANTSLHGHENDTTPRVETFAERATTYRQARAPGTESVSSHTSIFTGLSVPEHGVTNRRQRLAAGHTVWETLAADGYDTAVFSNNPFLTELPVGLRDAFDTVVGRREEQPFPEAVNPKNFVIDAADRGPRKYLEFLRAAVDNGRLLGSLANGVAFKFGGRRLPSALRPDSSAELYADRFLSWHENRDGPWAACVNFMDAHYPYEPGPEHDEWGSEALHGIQQRIGDQAWEFVGGRRPWGDRQAIEALYDGATRRMDAATGQILDGLAAVGELDDTLVVVTADHGEGFGERSRIRPETRIVGHGNGGLPECVLHVPLVVKYPGQTQTAASNRVTSLAEFPAAVEATLDGSWGVDAFLPDEEPVVCATAGVGPDTAEHAREYLGSIAPYDEAGEAVFETDDDGTVRKQLRWGDHSGTVRIRDAQTVWHESETAPDVAGVVEGLADAGVRESTAKDVDGDVKRRLEDLGYA